METEILLREFKDSPAGKALIAQHESERQAKRRAAVEAIRVLQQEYGAARRKSDTEIEEAEREHGKLQKKFTASILEMNRLGAERRIAAIDFDRMIAVQTDRLKETAHPCIEAAIDACHRKLMELGRKFDSSETRERDVWEIFHFTGWTNVNSVNERRVIIKKTIERLEAMQFEASENEDEEVKRLLSKIPSGPLESEVNKWDRNLEAERLETRGKLGIARRV
ncbi:MAG: hypothetical protein IH857_01600 [Deltaproteobacteria bacterium]|nr:hypothetical protein [Deltaproteobacteria bacterium]